MILRAIKKWIAGRPGMMPRKRCSCCRQALSEWFTERGRMWCIHCGIVSSWPAHHSVYSGDPYSIRDDPVAQTMAKNGQCPRHAKEASND